MHPFHDDDDDFVSIIISPASKRILDQYALSGEISGATLRPDGRYELRCDRETVERLREVDPDPDVAIASLDEQQRRGGRKQ